VRLEAYEKLKGRNDKFGDEYCALLEITHVAHCWMAKIRMSVLYSLVGGFASLYRICKMCEAKNRMPNRFYSRGMA
jgi:hypothetical protein